MKKFCPECGEKVSNVVMRLDEPTHVEPCGHIVRFDALTMTISKSVLHPGQRTSR